MRPALTLRDPDVKKSRREPGRAVAPERPRSRRPRIWPVAAGAVADLARPFGVYWINGFAMPETNRPGPGGSGLITYRRSDRSLADVPVTNGRGGDERVDSVVSFTGSAFRLAAA